MMKEKLNSGKGFTLAELLVVVAIVAVLAAIAIPIFAGATEKAAEAADLANVRSAYAELTVKHLQKEDTNPIYIPATQTQDEWQSQDGEKEAKIGTSFEGGSTTEVSVPCAYKGKTDGNYYKLTIDAKGTVKVEVSGEPPAAGGSSD